ncbi:DUF2487 family protein [Bacillus megaterium]|nr:DUF2487 family protein [Priestia megaterium]
MASFLEKGQSLFLSSYSFWNINKTSFRELAERRRKLKLQAKEMDVYLQSKSYVDTVLVPLIPIDFGEDLKLTASMSEYTTALTEELERQFKGRVILTPSFTYLKKDGVAAVYETLLRWNEHINDNEVKHLFVLTSDRDWLQYEKEIGAYCIWIPALPLEHIDESHKYTLIHEQVQQLLPIFVEKWSM